MATGEKTKAAIKRASRLSRSKLPEIDREARQQLRGVYLSAKADIERLILEAAGAGTSVGYEHLQNLLSQIDSRLGSLARDRDFLMDMKAREAARLGVDPFRPDRGAIRSSLDRIADDAFRGLAVFVSSDGLQLSDRIWRIDRHAKDVVGQAVQRHVVQGYSASQAASDFLARGEAVPADLQKKSGMSDAIKISRAAGAELMREDGPYFSAKRLFRTEINRAHGTAYQRAAAEHPDIVGTKFLLSPNHPKIDICDMHASVNRYGLGEGVYPHRKSPWPAHPNTLSFEVVVFRDEVGPAERKGKETRVDWLKRQPPNIQAAVVGTKKAWAISKGYVGEGSIGSKWASVKKRIERKGVSVPKKITISDIDG